MKKILKYSIITIMLFSIFSLAVLAKNDQSKQLNGKPFKKIWRKINKLSELINQNRDSFFDIFVEKIDFQSENELLQNQINSLEERIDYLENNCCENTFTDFDEDGWSFEAGDCNDNNPAVNPDATEICDGIDNNCDGVIDENDICEADSDNDGIIDIYDNCPTIANPNQEDEDNDGVGDACETTAVCSYEEINTFQGCLEEAGNNQAAFIACVNLMEGDCKDSINNLLTCSLVNHCLENAIDQYSVFLCSLEKCPTEYEDVFGITPEGMPCNDGDLCTQNTIWQSGTCTSGEPIICIDEFDCSTDSCDSNIGCIFDFETCDQSDNDGDGFLAYEDCNDNNQNIFPGATEECNGIDDNCDGYIDNDIIPQLYSSEGVCAGTYYECIGGELIAPDLSNIFGYLPSDTLCDGIDNDCDGQIDDEFLHGGSIHYESPYEGNLSLNDDCGLGVCAGGVVECSNNPEYLICSTHGLEEPELCGDGIDNDCDGQIDDNCETCGDLHCDNNEEITCPDDCGFCGDGYCEGDDNVNCPQDCTVCGDGFCDFAYGESISNCPEDCSN